jgi:hypothetical protein
MFVLPPVRTGFGKFAYLRYVRMGPEIAPSGGRTSDGLGFVIRVKAFPTRPLPIILVAPYIF